MENIERLQPTDVGLPAAPLTNWQNPPNLVNLKQDFMDAKPAHDLQKTKIATWLNNLHVEGPAKPQTPKGSSSIQPKLIRKQAEWRYAALSEPFLSTDDVFKVEPVSWEDREAAQQNQLVLNHQFNTKIDKVAFIDKYVRTGVDEGTIIVRCGWCFEEEEVTERVPNVEFVQNPELGPMHEQLAEMAELSPSQYQTDVPDELKQAHELTMEHGVPYEPVIRGYREVQVMRTTRNHPTVEVCNYRNITVDPTCLDDIEKAGFVIYSFESSLSQLKKDGRYKNLDKINVSGNSILMEPDHAGSEGSRSFNFSDQARMKIVVYEYWGMWDIDGSGKTKPIVAAWVGGTLIRLQENPYPDKKHPFISVQYLPVRESMYGEPDGALLEDNQKVIGAVTRGMIDLMGKSANSQTGMRKDMLDATNRRKFEKGQDYEFNAGVDPRQGVHQHSYPEIPMSAQFMLQLMNMEAESLTGVKAYSQGVSGAALGDVAAGVRGALDAASKRELGILRRLSNGIVKIGRKIIAMNSEFLSEEEVIRITNEEFVRVKRDDLAGNFDLKLSISTAEEDNNKAQELAFMLQTMGPNGDAELNKMILADICRLRKMPDMAKKIETYQPQPDPMQQKLQELELAKLEAEIAEIRAKAQKTLVDAGLSEAKIATEDAKANNLNSDTDNKNLDFVEQESGVKQERDLQKIGEQARSQMGLKVLDAEITEKKLKNDLVKEYIKNSARKSK